MKKIGFLLLILPLITGCWNMKELEHMFYAHALGIDYTGNQYVVYVQILDFAPLAKGGGGGQSQSPMWVGKGIGRTIDVAIHHLYAASQRRIFWGHLNTVILSEAALKKHKAEKLLDLVGRYNEFRKNMWIFATRDSIEKMLSTATLLEKSPVYSKLSDPRDTFHQRSFIEPIRLYRFLAYLHEPGHTSILPTLTVTGEHWSSENQKPKDVTMMTGICILKDGKWNSWLAKRDIGGMRWLNKDISRAALIIPVKQESEITIICENPEPVILPEMRNGQVFFNIKLRVTSSIIEMYKPATELFIRGEAERLIGEEIRKAYKKGLERKIDLLNLMEALYRKDPQGWHQLTKDGQFPLTEQSLQKIDVKMKIVSSGMTNLVKD